MQAFQPPEKPFQRRFKSNDSTVEKLGDLLTKNPQGLLVFRDELIGLLASWEKEGREGDKAFYLEGWNGTASLNIDRIGRGSLRVDNLCLSVFGGIQPELMERYLSGMATSLDNDGRIQRFQVLVYPESVPWVWKDRYPVKGAREAVRDLFDRLASFDPVQDGAAPADDFVKLPHFYFDDAAQEVFVEWCTELHRVHIANEQNPLMAQHFGKFEKLYCAIALILHLAEGSIGPVTARSALRAAAWCQYLAGPCAAHLWTGGDRQSLHRPSGGPPAGRGQARRGLHRARSGSQAMDRHHDHPAGRDRFGHPGRAWLGAGHGD
jgi:hypothetical protein